MKTRITTGIIGALLMILAIVLRGTVVFNIFIGLITVIAMIEAQVTTKLVSNSNLVILSCIYAFTSAFIPLFGFMPSGLVITAIYIFAAILIILSNTKEAGVYQAFYSIAITLGVSLGLTTIIYISDLNISKNYMYTKSDSLFFIILALAGAWLGDTGAYFVGSKFGKRKIAPVISPKKTVEGVFGSILSTVIGILILSLIWVLAVLDENSYIQFGWLILVSALCPLIGLVGDLFFSYIKRNCNIKDYGKIMPGHGGILDRFDSVILVAPFIYLILLYIPMIVHK